MATTTEARKEPPWAPPPVLFMGAPLQSRFSRRFSRPNKRKAEDDALGSPDAKRSVSGTDLAPPAAGNTISIEGNKNEAGPSERVVAGDVEQRQSSLENAVEQVEVLECVPKVLNTVVHQQEDQISCSPSMALQGEGEPELPGSQDLQMEPGELQGEARDLSASMGQDSSNNLGLSSSKMLDPSALSRVVLDQQQGQASSSSLNEVRVDDELEEGELPESQDLSQLQMEEGEWQGEAIELREPDQQADTRFKMPEAGLRKQGLPTLSLLSAAALIDGTPSEEPEFSLADWHAHITTGKPLVAVQQTAQAKKNKKRRNRRVKNKGEQQAMATQPGRTVVFSRPVQRDPLEALGKKVQAQVQDPQVQAQAQCQALPPQVQSQQVQIQVQSQVQSQVPFRVQCQAFQAHPRAQSQAYQAHPGAQSQVVPQVPSPAFQVRRQETIKEEPKVKSSNEPRPADESLTAIVEKFLGIEHEPEEEETAKRSQKRRLTAERKEKKRGRDRQKRAEKLRQLGLQRRRPVFVKPEPRPPPVCKYFLKGRCTKGTECGFSHDAVPVMKSELCKYFLTNCCLKGDDCPFSHDTSKFPCKYFVTTGRCKNGDGCRFAHRAVTEEEMEKVLKRLKKKTPEAETATATARGNGQDQEQVDDGEEERDGQDQVDGEKDRDDEQVDGEENRDEQDDKDDHRGRDDEGEYDPVFPGSSWWKDSEDAAAAASAAAAAAADEYDPIPAGSWWKMVAEAEKSQDPCSKADSEPWRDRAVREADKQTAVECGQRKSAMEILLERMDGLV